MTGQESWIPGGVDEDEPSAARLYDYLLGGAHNFAADRALAERFLAALPSAREVARLNRSFLRRAVVHIAEQGVRQFIDIGSGIPTVGNVHEIAQSLVPTSKVVYVDYEPVAVAHSQLMLEANEHATIVQADMLDPDDILNHPAATRLLDFSRPIGLIMAGVFHFVPQEADAPKVISRFRDALAPGSFLALSHFTADVAPESMAGVVEVMRRSADPVHPRTYGEIAELFAGFELVEPGIVGTARWRPDSPNEEADGMRGGDQIYSGVGRKP